MKQQEKYILEKNFSFKLKMDNLSKLFCINKNEHLMSKNVDFSNIKIDNSIKIGYYIKG